jgi:predicted nucleic acid-binding protein
MHLTVEAAKEKLHGPVPGADAEAPPREAHPPKPPNDLMTRHILDTNIFNRLCDGTASRAWFQELALVGTYVQRLEIEDTKQSARRAELRELFLEFTPKSELPYTTRWGDPWGSRWSDTDGLYKQILAAIRTLDKAAKKKKTNQNQERDAQIAETAIKANLTLISEDQNLREVITMFGGQSISLAQLADRNAQDNRTYEIDDGGYP